MSKRRSARRREIPPGYREYLRIRAMEREADARYCRLKWVRLGSPFDFVAIQK